MQIVENKCEILDYKSRLPQTFTYQLGTVSIRNRELLIKQTELMNSRFLTLLIILLLWLLLGSFLFNKYICGASAPTPKPAAAAAPVPVVPESNGEWVVRDGSLLNVSSPDYVQFPRSSSTPVALSQPVSQNLNQTAAHLKANNDRQLTITGYYDANESNSSIFSDMGLARADAIKRMLIAQNVPARQIAIASESARNDFFSGDRLRRGATFNFGALGDNSQRLERIRSKFTVEPITVYFGTNQDELNLSSQQRKDIGEIIYYLDNVDGSGLSIGGHTDNVGNRQSNITLSQGRANFVREYLTNNGNIPANKMSTNGFGPDNPIDTNATPEGRSKNRRVEVKLNL